MIQRLFVYGTLKPGQANAHLLEEIGGTWQEATIVGTLASEGWAAEAGYPALTLEGAGTEIAGFVFSSERLAQHWEMLDEFEGDDYERVLAVVKLDDHRTIEAYVYVLNTRQPGKTNRRTDFM